MPHTLIKRLLAEALGACLLTATVVGSGILASDFSAGNAGIALIGNTAATAAMLYTLITALGPVSGAHFNPAVSMIAAVRREISFSDALAYGIIQIVSCIAGTVLAHALFEQTLLQASTQVRAGSNMILSEAVAAFALVFTILATERTKPEAIAAAVAAVITAGYWWTASTSFANPAITIARAFTDTFAGVQPNDVPGFIFGQIIGALAALAVFSLIFGVQKKT
jgi:glycerol uptake facilitator-like aquaporin